MPEAYLELSAEDQKDILQTAAVQLGRQESVLEKDFWVCWALETLFSIPNAHPMAFKGGTSLSKVYDIIDRFSEDIDITLDYRHFDDIYYKNHPQKFTPFDEGSSKSQIAKYSERLKGYVKSYAKEVVVPHLQSTLNKLPTKNSHSIEVDDSGEKIWVSYPSVVEEPGDYIKTRTLIELGGRNVIEPNELHTITPYIASITEGVEYPSSQVVVLSPERTFWEKATLIHVECNRGELKQNAERLSRHWYDLVMLSRHQSGQDAINNRELFEDVIKHKKAFYNARYANYDDCLAGSLKLLPEDKTIGQLQSDYEKMLSSGMMRQESPSFADIVDSIRIMERSLNHWPR